MHDDNNDNNYIIYAYEYDDVTSGNVTKSVRNTLRNHTYCELKFNDLSFWSLANLSV